MPDMATHIPPTHTPTDVCLYTSLYGMGIRAWLCDLGIDLGIVRGISIDSGRWIGAQRVRAHRACKAAEPWGSGCDRYVQRMAKRYVV